MTSRTSGVGDHRIVPYDTRWPIAADALIGRLRRALGTSAVRLEHIGSTAVPGLAARPILDVQISVRDIGDRSAFDLPLTRAGYQHFVFAELLVDDYFVYVPSDGSNTEHVQVCEAESHQEHRHLAVRDYLRCHEAERGAYEETKRAAADVAVGIRARYSAAKNDHVYQLEQRALAWARGRND